MAACGVRHERMQNGLLPTGEPQDPVEGQRSGGHGRVLCESMLENQRDCIGRLKSLH